MEGLDPHYDVIVVGTGLPESIAAAALAKAGKSVLHLDKNPYYGSDWASFTLEGIMDWAATTSSLEDISNTWSEDQAPGADLDPATLLELVKGAQQEGKARKLAVEAARLAAEAESRVEDGGEDHNDTGASEQKGGEAPQAYEEENIKIDESEYEGWELECMPVYQQPRPPQIISQMMDCAPSLPPPPPPLAASHPSWAGQRRPRAAGGAGAVGAAAADPAALHPAFVGYGAAPPPPPPDPRPTAEGLLAASRRFSLDLSPRLTLGAGLAVDTMVRSGIGRYMEFKSIDGLFLCKEEGDASSEETFSRVPCLKGDVVKSKMLSVVEKRLLMRFLQYCMEWGQVQQGEDVTTQNERELGQGRMITRPQNKEQATKARGAAALDAGPFLAAGRPFAEFLAACKLTPRLQRLVLYALVLAPQHEPPAAAAAAAAAGGEGGEGGAGGLSTLAGLRAVARHLRGLGQYGETAFLASLYGASELPQAFCRTAAVHGATYMLDHSVACFIVERRANRVVGAVDQAGRVLSCGAAVVDPAYLPQLAAAGGGRRALRRVSVSTPPAPAAGGGGGGGGRGGRLAAVLPPRAAGGRNPAPVHVVALDHEAEVCPPGLRVAHLTTAVGPGDPLDALDAAAAALYGDFPRLRGRPAAGGRATGGGEDGAVADAEPGGGAGGRLICREVWGLTFAVPLHGGGGPAGAGGAAEEVEAAGAGALPGNLACAPRTTPELAMFDAFEQGRAMFSKLCPGLDFFPEAVFQDMTNEKDFDDHLLESALEKATEGGENSSEQQQKGATKAGGDNGECLPLDDDHEKVFHETEKEGEQKHDQGGSIENSGEAEEQREGGVPLL